MLRLSIGQVKGIQKCSFSKIFSCRFASTEAENSRSPYLTGIQGHKEHIHFAEGSTFHGRIN